MTEKIKKSQLGSTSAGAWKSGDINIEHATYHYEPIRTGME